jgi:hypothetical protein
MWLLLGEFIGGLCVIALPFILLFIAFGFGF